MKRKKSTTENTESTEKRGKWARQKPRLPAVEREFDKLQLKLSEITLDPAFEWQVLGAIRGACIRRKDYCAAAHFRFAQEQVPVPPLAPIILKALGRELQNLREEIAQYERSPAEWMLLIDVAVGQGKSLCAENRVEGLKAIRRVAALCIRALEQSGNSALEGL